MSIQYHIIETQDGSHTLQISGSQISFHSKKGAIQESQQVFVENGWTFYLQQHPQQAELRLLEVGFGTGLNALLTAIRAREAGRTLRYTALDRYPVSPLIYQQLNYPQHLGAPALYQAIMAAALEKVVSISPFFELLKKEVDLASYQHSDRFDIIYFDAFAPEDQPEMWEESIFTQLFELLNRGGVLVTYCSKTIVRKALLKVGFEVTKLPGPRGKREVIRAVRS